MKGCNKASEASWGSPGAVAAAVATEVSPAAPRKRERGAGDSVPVPMPGDESPMVDRRKWLGVCGGRAA